MCTDEFDPTEERCESDGLNFPSTEDDDNRDDEERITEAMW